MSNPLFQGIDTIIVRVSDIQLSKEWHLEKLGLKIIWENPNMKLVVLDPHGPTSLTWWETDKKIEQKQEIASYPIFRTQKAREAKQVLEQNGVRVGELQDDEAVRYFFFHDPDENILDACEVFG